MPPPPHFILVILFHLICPFTLEELVKKYNVDYLFSIFKFFLVPHFIFLFLNSVKKFIFKIISFVTIFSILLPLILINTYFSLKQ